MNSVDDGYKSLYMMLIYKFHVLELQIEMNVFVPRGTYTLIYFNSKQDS